MVDLDLIDSLGEFERYSNIPPLLAQQTIDLGHALLRAKAETEAEFLEAEFLDESAAALALALRETEATFVRLAQDHDPSAEAQDVAIESLTEQLWASLLDQLQGWRAFLHPGLDQLPPKSQAETQLPQLREKAARALILCGALFPTQEHGLVVHPPFHEQAQTIEAFVRLSKDEDWEDAAELAGVHMMPLLELIQAQHQKLISRRRWRKRQGSELGLQRNELRDRIGDYNDMVLTLIDDEDPKSIEMVCALVRPVDELLARMRSASEDEPGLALESAERAQVGLPAVGEGDAGTESS